MTSRPADDLSDAVIMYLSYGSHMYPRADIQAVKDAYGKILGGELIEVVERLRGEMGALRTDWSRLSLAAGSHKACEAMRGRHAELSQRALDALRWWFSYSWR